MYVQDTPDQTSQDDSINHTALPRADTFRVRNIDALEDLKRYADSIPEDKNTMRFINMREEVIEAFLRKSALHSNYYEVSGRESKTIITVDDAGSITEKYTQDGYDRKPHEVTEQVVAELMSILDVIQELGKQGDFDYL